MPEPQALLMPVTEAAIFLVVTADDGAEGDVQDLLADVSGLTRSVGFRIPDGELSCVVGIGSTLWDRLFAGARPAGLHPLAPSTTQSPRRAICCSIFARAAWTCASSWPHS